MFYVTNVYLKIFLLKCNENGYPKYIYSYDNRDIKISELLQIKYTLNDV